MEYRLWVETAELFLKSQPLPSTGLHVLCPPLPAIETYAIGAGSNCQKAHNLVRRGKPLTSDNGCRTGLACLPHQELCSAGIMR